MTTLELVNYRQRVFDLYRQVRDLGTATPAAWDLFRAERDDLFGQHPQSALSAAQKATFSGLPYYAYNPAYHVTATIAPVPEPLIIPIELADDGPVTLRRIGRVSFTLPTGPGALDVFWLMGYGGGVFLPFRDATNSQSTYGGGRYLFDTIKGADLGISGDQIVLDFNYAYQPSCAYNPRWVCPLAPPGNRLAIAVEAGERYSDFAGE